MNHKFFWPESMARDPKFKDYDVLSFGYQSACRSVGFNIPEIAKDLETELNESISNKTYKSLSFVAHSMGGLVAREFILKRHSKLKKKIPVENVVLLSTPHNGSGLASAAALFCDDNQLDHLKTGRGSYLDGLKDDWRATFWESGKRETFEVSAGYELVETGALFAKTLIVEKDSAVEFSHRTRAFIRDHSQIAKPVSEEDKLYRWARQELTAVTETSLLAYSESEEKRFREIIPQLQKNLSGAELEKALKLLASGRLPEAQALLSRFEKEEDQEIERIAKIRFSRAQVYELELDYPNALKYYERAVQLTPENTLYLNDAGFMQHKMGYYDKAIEYYEKALESDLKSFGPEHPKVATYWNNLGEAWRAKGEYDKAIDYYEKALASDLKSFGPEHPDVAIDWNNLGEAWRAKGDYDKAIEYFEKALASDLKSFGPEHPDVAIDWNNLGLAWKSKGEYDKAIDYYEKALVNLLRNYSYQHPYVGSPEKVI